MEKKYVVKTAKDLARYEKYTDSANSLEKTNVQKSLDELVAKLDELGLSLPTSSDLDSGDMADA